MTPELANQLRISLAGNSSEAIPSREIAQRAIQACEELSKRLSRVLGEHGFNTLFKRSALDVATWWPRWRLSADPWRGERRDNPWLWLRTSMEQEDSETATEGFILVMSGAIDLLMRLVGETLANQLLEDDWPILFPRLEDPPRHTS
jgi:hypothetical protein